MRKSFANRLIIYLMLSSTLVIGAGLSVDFFLSKEEILTRLQDQSEESINRAIIDLENLLQSIEGTTLLLGKILEQREYSRDGLRQILKDLVDGTADIYGATIALSPSVSSSTQGFAPYYYRAEDGSVKQKDLRPGEQAYWQRSWFRDPATAGKPIWVEPYFDSEGARVLMTTFSVPVFRLNEEKERFLYAVVTADLPLAELQQYLAQLRLGKSGFGLLFSDKGVILGAKDPADTLMHFEDAISPPQETHVWERMLSDAASGKVVHEELNCKEFSGPCRVRLSKLNTTGWPVGVAYSVDEVLSPLYEYEIKTGLIGALTILVVCLTVAAVARKITQPISELSLAANEIAKGNLIGSLPQTRAKDEVSDLIAAFSDMREKLQDRIKELEIVTANRSRLEGELNAAREIQMSMLPGSGEALWQQGGIELWAKVRPAKTVGGDLYTYFESGKHLFIAVGDVSDKGVAAALFMARAISLIQQLAGISTPPDKAMVELNNALERDNSSCMFVTLFLGVLDINSGQLYFSSAGHTPPSLVRSGTVMTIAQETGPALGLETDQFYPLNSLMLMRGDRVAVYTDGIDEAFNDQKEMYGIERFNHKLLDSAAMPVATSGKLLFESVDKHTGNLPQSDDITLLLLHLGTSGVQKTFNLGPELTGRVQSWLETALELRDIPDETIMEFDLVTEEIVTNIQKYSGLNANDSLTVMVEALARTLVLEVRDEGKPFNPFEDGHRSELGADIDSAEIGGLGVHLIAQLTDKQSYCREGDFNVLRVEKNITGQGTESPA